MRLTEQEVSSEVKEEEEEEEEKTEPDAALVLNQEKLRLCLLPRT